MERDIEQLNSALNSIKTLRSNVRRVFESVSNGLRADHGEDGKENKFIHELQELLTTVNNNLRDVESAVGNLTPPPGPFNLGSTAFLGQETTQERQALYGQLVNSYKWTDKVREYSALAGNILQTNSFNKTYKTFSTTKRRKTQTSNHNVSPEVIENLITNIDRLFPDVTITASRPFLPNPVIQACLGRVLKAIIAFKGLMIEWVVVKALSESNDLWAESRYKVFKKVTENCHAAMCHFHSPMMPELAVKSFMHWFHSYNTLFSAPCKRCGNHLLGNLPPTWRDLRTLEPYHEECK
ncbi:mediator of RNA polymerase II transcription subunit 27 [Tribolium castaneum]|uniref:Mediator of RNA polymerase II transcription subunit 27-like Protein n=1 Tax=Tribolium castaneum TaxID=7070 RepID=D6WH39_TRICA|nr:PREDICTED: mediator of RNA polymerase II transcription subunit 27 [Tribolium castaneum]EFA00114.1 Mediator of RNA polymerase II transcription subunit 27-like Protein [Tribolium castaneum]|eukprot:XP_974974.1 PREDICTED: mediator of RNA polymerase II transcription subunit 27 [Tribolium castaneum]